LVVCFLRHEHCHGIESARIGARGRKDVQREPCRSGRRQEIWAGICEISQSTSSDYIARLWDLTRALDNYLCERTKLVPISSLKATHNCISNRFRHGSHQGQSLDKLVQDLRTERLDPAQTDLGLEAAYYRGKLRCIANRRTWCLWTAFGRGTNQDFTYEKRALVRVLPLVPGIRTHSGQEFLFKFYDANSSQTDGEELTFRCSPPPFIVQ